jgi:hypothetical protein
VTIRFQSSNFLKEYRREIKLEKIERCGWSCRGRFVNRRGRGVFAESTAAS